MNNENYVERDIIKNSYYVIYFFNQKGVEVTNLKLQKLMYFLEAIYMIIADDDHLFEEQFLAWNFGPVNKKLYDYYKNFGSDSITLNSSEAKSLTKFPELNKSVVEVLFKLFGEWNAYQLVELTHEENSPWSMVYIENETNIVVPKEETKKWMCNKLEFGQS